MTTRLVVSSILSLSVASLVGACGMSSPSSSATDADFETESQPQLARTVDAALGLDTTFAVLIATGYATAPTGAGATSCPAVASVGGKLAVTGGCTTSDGETIAGSALLDNVASLGGTGNDPSRPQSLEFDNLVLTNADGSRLTLDGLVTIDTATGTNTTTSLDLEIGGLGAHSETTVQCDAAASCAYGGGSLIDVAGVGTAALTGSWTSDFKSVDISVIGVRPMALSRDATNTSCVDYAIDGGTSGQLCNTGSSPSVR